MGQAELLLPYWLTIVRSASLSTPQAQNSECVDPKEIVRAGYDRVSHAYRDDDGRGPSPHDPKKRVREAKYGAWLAELSSLLTPRAPVLDLGCGCGVPATQILAENFAVTGVDFSSVQIERARKLVPDAQFICADMATVDFPRESFAAIVSFYAIIHLPLAEQPDLFANFRRWLRPGGYLMLILGRDAWTGTELYLGAQMYWSHADTKTYVSWLGGLGFRVLSTRFIPEGDGGHTLLLAQRSI